MRTEKMSPVPADPFESCPVTPKIYSKKLNDSVVTEITIQEFSNRLLIFVSQCEGRLGSFVEVTPDKPAFDQFNPSANTYDIKVLFGVDTEDILLAARIFAGALSTDKPILFSIAIKDFSKENLFAVRDLLSKY